MLLRSLAHSVRIRERGVFRIYCRDIAERRVRQGFSLAEVEYALSIFRGVCRDVLARDRRATPQWARIEELLDVTFEFGIDAIEEVYEEIGASTEEAADEAARDAELRDASR
jgi:hypothetical protein